MNTTPLTPTRIEPQKNSQDSTSALIEWSTGERYTLSYIDLRFNCPCASCVDEHSGERTIQLSSISPEIRPTQVQVVGRYAIQFTWSDQHSTGMYHFDRLHQLCQTQGHKLA